MSAPIEDYGMIGDCETAALVGRDGSIDWLCWPRFDSDACFAALLGKPEQRPLADRAAGRDHARRRRCYRDDTLILETTFETDDGAVTVIDFMLPRGAHVRPGAHRARRRGEVAMCMELVAALRLRRDRALGDAPGGRQRCAPSPAPTWWCCARPVDMRGENFKTVASSP